MHRIRRLPSKYSQWTRRSNTLFRRIPRCERRNSTLRKPGTTLPHFARAGFPRSSGMYSAGNFSLSLPLPSTEACLARIPVLAPYRETKLKSTFLASLTAMVFGQILQPLSQQYRLGLGVKAHSLERRSKRPSWPNNAPRSPSRCAKHTTGFWKLRVRSRAWSSRFPSTAKRSGSPQSV